ncbi:MAG: DUF4350 domain-containing protein [Myxococcaceae bacterium]
MRDRFPILLMGGLLLFGFLGSYVLQGARRAEFADALSTYRSEKGGARALYLLAEQNDLPVGRIQKDLSQAPKGSQLLLLGVAFDAPVSSDAGISELEAELRGSNLVYAPEIDAEEAEQLLEHVRTGHTLVYAPWLPEKNPLLDALQVDLVQADHKLELRTLEPALPSPWTLGVQRVEARVSVYLDVPNEAIPLLVDPQLGETLAALVPYGQGQVVVLGAPELASNSALVRADNAQLWLSLLSAASAGKPLLFDEYHHGFTSNRSIGEFARRYGLHFAAAQLLLGIVLWAAALRRFGRPRPPEEQTRQGSTDALFATSRLYREGHHWQFAASQILRQLCSELAPYAGISPRTPGPELADALLERGRRDLGLRLHPLLARARAVNSDADLQNLARDAALLRASLHHPLRTPRT